MRILCPVCQARFPVEGEPLPGMELICPVCGQQLVLCPAPDGAWVGVRREPGTERELRSRIEEFARRRGFAFGEMKEEIVEGLVAKSALFGDCFCPCRLLHESDYLCPCKPTRMGDVLTNGRCHCGLFVVRNA